MTRLLSLFAVVLLLIIWLIYRETRHRKRTKAWAKEYAQKNSNKYQQAINTLRQSETKQNPQQHAQHSAINSLNAEPPEALTLLKITKPAMLNEEAMARCIQVVDSIKRPHPALQKITSNVTTEELIDILHGSPDITAKILTTVNSAAFALAQPITSINHAVIYLGSSLVKSIAMNFLIKKSMDKEDPIQKAAYKKLWTIAYITSSMTFSIGQYLSKLNAAELSTKALLTNIGYFALAAYDKKFATLYLEEPSLIKRIKFEQAQLDLNACVIGYYLAQKWQLPHVMSEHIMYSNYPLKYTLKLWHLVMKKNKI